MSNKLPPDPADGFDPVPLSQPTAHGQAKRHSEFYFDNTLIVIQVEDTLFNVHKYQLLKSEAFAHMFKEQEVSPGAAISKEGLTPDYPIVLAVKASEFGALLTLLYADHFTSNRPSLETSLIIPAFRLANMWGFSDLRSYLLPIADKVLGDAEKIGFAQEFNLRDWLLLPHIRLCQREEPLTREEGTKLSIDSLLMISRVREEFPPSKIDAYANQVQYCDGLYFECWECGEGNNVGHCARCTEMSYTTVPTPESITQTIEERIKKWIENDCIFTG